MTKLGVILGALAFVGTTTPTGTDAILPRSEHRLEKKPSGEANPNKKLLGTLIQTHTDEHVIVDDANPPDARFSQLLADHITGEAIDLDPRLLGLLRQILAQHEGARIELVSGYRSKKLNEMMRKKGHHVASHSQHSLGHAVDFRVVLPEETKGIDPRILERDVRALGWDGGVGVYTLETDWFVHCDVGPRRNWSG